MNCYQAGRYLFIYHKRGYAQLQLAQNNTAVGTGYLVGLHHNGPNWYSSITCRAGLTLSSTGRLPSE